MRAHAVANGELPDGNDLEASLDQKAKCKECDEADNEADKARESRFDFYSPVLVIPKAKPVKPRPQRGIEKLDRYSAKRKKRQSIHYHIAGSTVAITISKFRQTCRRRLPRHVSSSPPTRAQNPAHRLRARSSPRRPYARRSSSRRRILPQLAPAARTDRR